jgi:hypothetical protein
MVGVVMASKLKTRGSTLAALEVNEEYEEKEDEAE